MTYSSCSGGMQVYQSSLDGIHVRTGSPVEGGRGKHCSKHPVCLCVGSCCKGGHLTVTYSYLFLWGILVVYAVHSYFNFAHDSYTCSSWELWALWTFFLLFVGNTVSHDTAWLLQADQWPPSQPLQHTFSWNSISSMIRQENLAPCWGRRKMLASSKVQTIREQLCW